MPPYKLEYWRILAGESSSGHETRVESIHGQCLLWELLKSSVEGVGPQDVHKLAGRIALPPILVSCFRVRMRQLFGGGIFGVRDTSLLGRVVCTTSCNDDSCSSCQLREEEMEEEGMAEVVYGKGRLYAIRCLLKPSGEL